MLYYSCGREIASVKRREGGMRPVVMPNPMSGIVGKQLFTWMLASAPDDVDHSLFIRRHPRIATQLPAQAIMQSTEACSETADGSTVAAGSQGRERLAWVNSACVK